MWTEAGVNILNEVVDRAHKIGPSRTDKNTNAQCKSVIVRFMTFPSQDNGFHAKKKIKSGMRTKLDLMKSRYTLLDDGNKIVKSNLDVKLCYADINCRLKWVDESIDDKLISSMDKLREILGNH